MSNSPDKTQRVDGKGNIQGDTMAVRPPRWEGQYLKAYYGCPVPPLGRAIFRALLRLSVPPLGRAMFKARRRLSVRPLGRAMFKARRRLSVPPLGRAIFKARRRLSVPPVGKGNVQGATTPVRSPVGKGNIQGATTPLRSPRWEGQFRALLWLSVRPEGNRRGTGSPSPRSSKNLPLVGEVWGEGKESWTPRRYAALDAGDTGRSRTCE